MTTDSISEAMIEAGIAALVETGFHGYDARDQVADIYLAMSRASQPVEPVCPTCERPDTSTCSNPWHIPPSITPPVDTGVLCVHGKPYPCERQSDWGCKPANCTSSPVDSERGVRAAAITESEYQAPVDSEAVERDNLETVRRAIWNLVPGQKEATVDVIARAALTAMKEDDRG